MSNDEVKAPLIDLLSQCACHRIFEKFFWFQFFRLLQPISASKLVRFASNVMQHGYALKKPVVRTEKR